MLIHLPTIPSFVRHSFPKVRLKLTGELTPQFVLSPEKTIQHAVQWSGVFASLGRRFLGIASTLVIIASFVIGISIAAPAVYYQFFPADVVTVTPQENGTAFGGDFNDESTESIPAEVDHYIPPIDETLPEGDWLVIPRIGVRTALQPTENPEEALQTGVWQVPDFGSPGSRDVPMILAAHRYGWQWWWKTDYWKYHSFYLLPDTIPGDRVEVISGNRKWLYEIYAGEEGEEITDYTADLILYTCKFLQSPVRHFRYARLIDPTMNTQVGLLQ